MTRRPGLVLVAFQQRGSRMPRDRVRALLHDLARVHRLVTVLERTDTPDLGPRFEVKPRL